MSPRYYHPGETPLPARRRLGVGSAARTATLTRQQLRAIRRELEHPSFARARAEAARHGWRVPPAGALPRGHTEHGWRHYWLGMLDHDAQQSRGVAHPPRPVVPHVPGGAPGTPPGGLH